MDQTIPIRRASIRHPAIASRARIEWLERGALRQSEARLVNISRGGALLVANFTPPLQHTVWITVEEPIRVNEWQAKVIRHDTSNRVGISFLGHSPAVLALTTRLGINGSRLMNDRFDAGTNRLFEDHDLRNESSLIGPRRGLTILVVEDDPSVSYVFGRMLNAKGHMVITAADGAEAWSLLQKCRVQLVLSDWMMPVMDGLELCRRIRGRAGAPYTYVILATARGGSEDRIEGLAAGADDFLAKPFDMREVTARLEIAWCLIAIQEDLEEKNTRLATLATIDALTGVSNRLRFAEALAKHTSLAVRTGMPLSLIMFDVDHFKGYNDGYGHPAGDEVLRTLGRLLLGAVREHDVVARYGGEEFGLLLPGTDADPARRFAERLRSAVARIPWPLRPVTASFGVATLSAGAAEDAVLVQQADQALYRSKLLGRNRVTHHHDLREGRTPVSSVPPLADSAAQTPGDDDQGDALVWEAIGTPRFRGAPEGTATPPVDVIGSTPGEEPHDPITLAAFKAYDPIPGLEQGIDAIIEAWIRALSLRDKETSEHSQRATAMTGCLARALGIEGEALVHVLRAALHDIGKIGIPDAILQKTGPLDEDEWRVMRRHPEHAREMLAPIAPLRPALDIPYCHHERWDGSGYPRGLKGEEIPLAARIFAAVDVWDALSSDRPYRSCWPENRIRAHLATLAGTHLDPEVVTVFLRTLDGDIVESAVG